MENENELFSSLSFASSSYTSNGSSTQNLHPGGYEPVTNPELLSLTKLSGCLEKLLLDSEFNYSDAEIVVEGTSVSVNRCILASRSLFFHDLFKKTKASSQSEGKPKYLMTELVPHGKIGYETFLVFLNYVYTGKLKPSPPEVSTCVDESCAHDACGPAINYAVELMYASATFQIKELVMVVQQPHTAQQDEMHGTLLLEEGPPEEQSVKKMRYMELKDEVMKAFDKDKAENNWANFSSSSSCSSSPKAGIKSRKRSVY